MTATFRPLCKSASRYASTNPGRTFPFSMMQRFLDEGFLMAMRAGVVCSSVGSPACAAMHQTLAAIASNALIDRSALPDAQDSTPSLLQGGCQRYFLSGTRVSASPEVTTSDFRPEPFLRISGCD